jgi:hypothetical protein
MDYEEIMYALRTGKRLCGYVRTPHTTEDLGRVYGYCALAKRPCHLTQWDRHQQQECPIYQAFVTKRQQIMEQEKAGKRPHLFHGKKRR